MKLSTATVLRGLCFGRHLIGLAILSILGRLDVLGGHLEVFD